LPIKPENKHRYPPKKEWEKIRAAILKRAGNKCECLGECGLDYHSEGSRCYASNGESIYWVWYNDQSEGGRWVDMEGFGSEPFDNFRGPVKIVLTTAHLDHTPENNDPDNLRVFCQKCHLRYDREHHAATRKATMEKNKIRDAEIHDLGLGQGRLF